MGTSKFQRPTLALAPLLLLACGGGVAAPAPEGFGWEAPFNAFVPPTPAGDRANPEGDPGTNPYERGLNPYQSPGKPQPNPQETLDAGKKDATIKDVSVPDVEEEIPDVNVPDVKKDSGGGGCYASCAGTLTCTPESGGTGTTAELTPVGTDCELAVGSSVVTLECGGSATLSSVTGTWTDTAGTLKLCFTSGGSQSCTICE